MVMTFEQKVMKCSPSYQEYYRLQRKYEKIYGQGRTLVVIEMGTFFEVYAYPAEGLGYGNLERLSEITDVTLTRKNKKEPVGFRNPNIVGFPVIAVTKYFKLLMKHGFTIIAMEQVSRVGDEIERKVTGIYTAGTYMEDLKSTEANNLVSVYVEEVMQLDGSYLQIVGLSKIDVSTGQNMVHEVHSLRGDERYALDEATRFLKNNQAQEILITIKNLESMTQDKLLMYLEVNPQICYIYDQVTREFLKLPYQNQYLNEIFQFQNMLSPLENLNLERMPYATVSYMILLDYVANHNQDLITKINLPEVYTVSQHLYLGNDAVMQLNILPNQYLDNTGQFGSLYEVVNQAQTPMGKRYLKECLLNPLVDPNKIQQKYRLTETIMVNAELYDILDNTLKGMRDLERLHRRIALQRLHPTEFVRMHYTYEQVIPCLELVNNTPELAELDFGLMDDFREFMDEYMSQVDLDEMSKYNIIDIASNIFKPHVYPEINELQQELDQINDFMANIGEVLTQIIPKTTKTKTLEMKNNTHGLYFDLTESRTEHLKKYFKKNPKIRVGKQMITTDTFYFHMNGKKARLYNTKVDGVRNQLETIQKLVAGKTTEKYKEFLVHLHETYGQMLHQVTTFISELDFIYSNAKTAKMYNYCQPTIQDQPSFIHTTNLRHPIVERIETEYEYISNDVILDQETRGLLVYGLNSAGKTTLMKAVGMSLVLAQAGFYVPAQTFEYSPYHALFARITGNDNLFKGLSSFALEMTELRAILKRADDKTLVIGDEICRGTEQTSGNAIVAASIVHLSRRDSSFMFASHLHDIPTIPEVQELSNIKFFHLRVDYDETHDALIFNRKLTPGPGESVYGLTVAKYLLHDRDFVELANGIKNNLTQEPGILTQKTSRYNSEVYVHTCQICGNGNTGDLDTHHINFQKDCQDGFVAKEGKTHLPMNNPANLAVLCKECHQDVHRGKITIAGYLETSKGKTLEYTHEPEKPKKKKYDEQTVAMVIKMKTQPKMTQQLAKTLLKQKHDVSISVSTIGKMWRGDY